MILTCKSQRRAATQTTLKGETMSKLEELKTQLTLKFIAGRRPSDAEMVEVERLRDEIAELENAQRRDISWCKS
jgi:polyhydroxyalkanoate synthesis regulator phasin